MMIVADNTVRRYTKPSIIPWQSISNDAQTTETKIAQMESGYSKIPSSIREPMEQWFALSSFPGKRFKFSAVAAESHKSWAQYPVAGLDGLTAWSGIYLGADTFRPAAMVSACITTNPDNRDRTIVHEFGHHLDNFGAQLLLEHPVPQRLIFMNDMELHAFAGLVSPSIPEGVYGKGNPYEWFAEMFARQILEDAEGVINLCGRSATWANEGRQKFLNLLPMMPPVNQAPTVITSALPAMKVGVPVSFQFEQFGWGKPVTVWESQFPIGNGLTLSSSGLLTGTPINPVGAGNTTSVRAANAVGVGLYKSIPYAVTA